MLLQQTRDSLPIKNSQDYKKGRVFEMNNTNNSNEDPDIHVEIERSVHAKIKELADSKNVKLKDFATDRLNMMAEKIEFNKKYFGPQFSITKTDLTDMVLVHDAKKDQTYIITLENNKLHCSVCKSSSCVHVFFTLATPDSGLLQKKLSFNKSNFNQS